MIGKPTPYRITAEGNVYVALDHYTQQEDKMITDSLIEHVKKYEGFSTEPYKDTKGKWTVGYGRNLEDNPLTLDETIDLFQMTDFISDKHEDDFFEGMLEKDISEHTEELLQQIPWLANKPTNVKMVICDMAYNLGVPTLMTFTGMLNAARHDDWLLTAYEILDSNYAEDVKTRAVANAKIVAGGQYQEAVDLLSQRNTARYNAIEQYL